MISFGHALEALKTGDRAARAGWSGVYLSFEKGRIPEEAPEPEGAIDGIDPALFVRDGDEASHPKIVLHDGEEESADWTPEQEDLLASDWIVSPPA